MRSPLKSIARVLVLVLASAATFTVTNCLLFDDTMHCSTIYTIEVALFRLFCFPFPVPSLSPTLSLCLVKTYIMHVGWLRKRKSQEFQRQ